MGTNAFLGDVEKNGSKSSDVSSRPKSERRYRIALFVLVPIVIALLIALIVIAVKAKISHSAPEICTSHGCIKSAAIFLDSMNWSADPCKDFYQFSCGNWIASHMEGNGTRVFGEAAKESMVTIINYLEKAYDDDDIPKSVKEVIKGYKVCTSFEKLEERHKKWLLQIFRKHPWPMINDSWDENSYDWSRNHGTALKDLFITKPIVIEVSPNPYINSENLIAITQPSPVQEELNEEVILNIAAQLGNKDNASLKKEFQEVLRIQEIIAKLSTDAETLMTTPTEISLITIKELGRKIPGINWLNFTKGYIGLYDRKTAVSISENDTIYLFGATYVETMIKLINNGSIAKRALANLAAVEFLHVMMKLNPALASDVNTLLWPKLRRRRQKFSGIEPKKLVCFNFFSKFTASAIDYIYYKYRKEGTMSHSMTDYAFKAMAVLVKKSSWLDEETQSKVLEKLEAMNVHLGFSELAKDKRGTEAECSDLPAMTNNSLENIYNIMMQHKRKDVLKLHAKNIRGGWPDKRYAASAQVNAFHMPNLNALIIPAGIQIPPYFDPDRPMYLNFGGMGLIVGHEITHGLDVTGSLMDKHGNRKNWWTDKAKSEFEKRGQCFIDQYSVYDYGGTNYTVDGKKTLSENLADNGGIRQSFLAHKMWEKDHGKGQRLPGLENYSPDQMFFVSFARSWCSSLHPPAFLALAHKNDEHSADMYRIIGSLSNSKEFADAFKCKPGSSMNPEKKCIAW